jgi:hypothetical protein
VKNNLDTNRPAKLKVFGTTRGARAYGIRDFLTRGDVPFEWVEVTDDEQARGIGLENMAGPAFTRLRVRRWLTSCAPSIRSMKSLEPGED